MSDPEVIADRERYAEVGREYRELEPAHELAREYVQLARRPRGRAGAAGRGRRRPRAAQAGRRRARPARAARRARSAWRWSSAIPTTPRTCWSRSGPGPGGDEAALFAGDLFKMLTRYAEQRGFATEVISPSPAEVGGFKEVTFAIKGEGAYSVFKYEGGTHRVQRVPKTESQGRIHTSTATVAVLPEAEEVEVEIDPERPPGGRLSLLGARRPVGQHHRLRGPHDPQADRDRRLDAGREVPAPEPREGDAGAAGPPLRAEARRAAGRDRLGAPLPGRLGRALGEDPHLQLPPEPGHRPPGEAHRPQPRRGAGAATCASSRTRSRPRRSASCSRRRPPKRRPDGSRRRPREGSARRWRRQRDALAAAGVETPRLDAELLLAEATGWDRARLAAEPEARGGRRRRAALRRDGAAPGPARAGRLHPRPQGLSPARAGGRRPGADPAARDRAPGRDRARARAAARRSTSAPGPAPSRWRSPTSCRSAR